MNRFISFNHFANYPLDLGSLMSRNPKEHDSTTFHHFLDYLKQMIYLKITEDRSGGDWMSEFMRGIEQDALKRFIHPNQLKLISTCLGLQFNNDVRPHDSYFIIQWNWVEQLIQLNPSIDLSPLKKDMGISSESSASFLFCQTNVMKATQKESYNSTFFALLQKLDLQDEECDQYLQKNRHVNGSFLPLRNHTFNAYLNQKHPALFDKHLAHTFNKYLISKDAPDLANEIPCYDMASPVVLNQLKRILNQPERVIFVSRGDSFTLNPLRVQEVSKMILSKEINTSPTQTMRRCL